MKTNFKTPILSAIAFFGTLGILSVGYSAYVGLTSVSSGQPLTVSMWTQVKDNFADLDSRTAGLASSGNKIGIGTSAPAGWLHVSTSQATSLGNPSQLLIENTSTADISRYANVSFKNGWGTTGGVFLTPDNNTSYSATGGSLAIASDPTKQKPVSLVTGNVTRLTVDGVGNVGIGTTTPSEKLEINGNLKFTSNGSIISKAPRAIHSTDPVTGCPPSRPANSDLWTMPITLDRPATVFLSGDLIKNSTLRGDLQLYLDGNFLMQTIAPAVSNDWAGAHVQWTGTLPAGNHVVSLRSPQANIWGCGTNWGTMDALIFEH